MGLRLRKRIKIIPGVYFNLSKSGVSASIGPKGLTTNIKAGRKSTTTMSVPGTGVAYQVTHSSGAGSSWMVFIFFVILALVVGLM